MVKVRQVDFSGGILGKNLRGRSDHERYQSSLFGCQDWIPDIFGGISNRPGTEYLGSLNTPSAPCRLIEFVHSTGASYIIEFQQSVFRVWYRGAFIAIDGAAFVKSHSVVPDDDLPKITFHQSGDILTWMDPEGGACQQIMRMGHNDWDIRSYTTNRVLLGGPNPPTALIFEPVWSAAFLTIHQTPQRYTGAGAGPDRVPMLQPKAWVWAVSAISADGIEGKPVEFDPGTPLICERGMQNIELQWSVPNDLGQGATAKRYAVYRGIKSAGSPIYGLIMEFDDATSYSAGAGTVDFNDDGREPDYTIQPLKETSPFETEITAGTTNWPNTGCYHEQRQWFGGLNNKRQRLRASRVGDYYNHDFKTFPPHADSPMQFDVASLRGEEIRHLIPLRDLICLSDTTEYRISGAQRGPITPFSIEIKPQSYNGSSWVTPVVVDASVVFVQERHAALLDLAFDYQIHGYRSNKLSDVARHLVDGYRIVDMCYQRMPYQTVWMVRDDGKILGCTYLRSAGVVAWHEHQLADGAKAISIACIPEEHGDRVYICTKRDGAFYLERWAYGHTYENRSENIYPTADNKDEPTGIRSLQKLDGTNYEWTIGDTNTMFAWHLDFATGYNGHNNSPNDLTIDGTAEGYAEGDTVTVTADGAGTFSAGDIGRVLTADPRGENGGPFRCEITTYIGASGGTEVKALVGSGGIEADYQNVAFPDWSLDVDTLTGLTQLSSRDDVYCWADGVQIGPFSVTGGGVLSLGAHYGVIVAGLLYQPELELLDVSDPGNNLRTVTKGVGKVWIETEDSTGLKAGEDSNNLDNLNEEDGSDLAHVRIKHGPNTGGRVVVKQSQCGPVRIRGITREVSLGD